MLLHSESIAPYSGEYTVYGEDGSVVGTLCIDKGAYLPPPINPLGYYALEP